MIGFEPCKVMNTSPALSDSSKYRDVRLWDAANGYCVRTIQYHTDWVRNIYPSLDAKFILSIGDDILFDYGIFYQSEK
jgi:platelet-activating factor acetylhydrolase IB subunit alpha